jgi:hypothetical protein
MPSASYYREQAAIFDRVADQCSVPALVPYYRRLSKDYRARADEIDLQPRDTQGQQGGHPTFSEARPAAAQQQQQVQPDKEDE